MPVVIFEPPSGRSDKGNAIKPKQPNMAELKGKRRIAGDK